MRPVRGALTEGFDHMADYDNQVLRPRSADQAIDQGLKAYMLGIYNYMMLGLATTGLVGWAVFRLAFTTDPAAGVGQVNSVYYVTQFGHNAFRAADRLSRSCSRHSCSRCSCRSGLRR